MDDEEEGAKGSGEEREEGAEGEERVVEREEGDKGKEGVDSVFSAVWMFGTLVLPMLFF